MGVSTKGRRKIIVDDRLYVWYIKPDFDSEYHVLNIVSEDKQMILSCPLRTQSSYIISKGKIFQNCKTDGCWNRYLLPFNIPEIIMPKFVAEVISWATHEENAVVTQWNGKDIPV